MTTLEALGGVSPRLHVTYGYGTGGQLRQLDAAGARDATAVPLDVQLANDVVRLRAMTGADARVVNQASVDPETARFTCFAQPRDERDTRDWIESQPALRGRGEAIDFGILRSAGWSWSDRSGCHKSRSMIAARGSGTG